MQYIRPERKVSLKTDLTGKIFGRLTVVGKLEIKDKYNNFLWACKCECGNEKITNTPSLNSGQTSSCGCLHKETMSALLKTHGMKHTSEYRVWAGIKRRCYNKNEDNYSDYGGRGITMCEKWKNDFMAFYNDMGLRPSKDHSIDRKDVNGNYCKENCRWATSTEQANNRRNNRFYLHNGVSRTLAGWCRELNLKYSVVWERLELGWAFERAITEPINDRKRDGIYS